jgi:hypothetical protein
VQQLDGIKAVIGKTGGKRSTVNKKEGYKNRCGCGAVTYSLIISNR